MRWVALVVALVLLNVSLTFSNVWPTLAIRFSSDLSVELAVIVIALVLSVGLVSARRLRAQRWLAVAWVALVFGRYADVTARSLYGRDVNLFWDLRHIPNVGAMFAAVADPWLRLGVISSLVLAPLVIYALASWALGRVIDATGRHRARGVLSFLAGGVLVIWAAQSADANLPGSLRVAAPVSPAYARELSELVYEVSGAGVRSLPPAPELASSLAGVAGADVFLIFLESYGAVSWDRQEFSTALRDSRARLATDIEETGRGVVSARIGSTTFGGESWLAHISLLSGTEVRDPRTNKRLMAQDRDTLVKIFGRHAYRTVAVMPGLQHGWPQGAFYGFDEIYDLAQLDYRGPPFGWWGLNDQFALARVDEVEVAPQPRSPLFVFFPTVTSHAPFVPTPPYQPDWKRVLTSKPYDADELNRAWADYPDWLNLGPSYIKALGYAYRLLGGYLRLRADRDFVMVLVGDHQPPSLVSGEGASWDVPVHVVTSRQAVMDRLRRHDFVDGLGLPSVRVARMDTLLPLLLDAFGGDTTDE